jgi:hypothetical protein
MCNDAGLPSPIIVAGTTSFEPTLRQLALKLASEPSPRTVIYAIGAPSSCAGVGTIVSDTDLGGTTGFHYTQSGLTYVRDSCMFAAGQKAHLAVSDVFYESCAGLPQPKPADITDVLGPVQASIFVAPAADTATVALTYEEARAIYGCGVSSARPVAGFADPMAVFCWNADAGPPLVVAGNLGVAPSMMIPPRCAFGGGTSLAVTQNLTGYGLHTIGFITADGLDDVRTMVSPLAFRAAGQTKAFLPDSDAAIADRRNVRDGHYTLWGYEHFFTRAGGNASAPATELIGWLTGAKSNARIDYVAIEGSAGLIPQCAMRVKRSAEGGLLSSYTPPEPCPCAFEAASTKSIPADCVVCTSNTMCSGGRTCRRGFCE